MGSRPYGPVPMHLGLTGEPFVPHNLKSTQKSPVALLKFQMAPRLKILMASGSKKGTQTYISFSLKSPRKQTPSRFPKQGPYGERYLFTDHFVYLSKTSSLGSPLKQPSLKVPLMESLAERCPTTTALLHSPIKVPSIRSPLPYIPASQIYHRLKV